ncbi:MAG: c-type cytochrome [Caulobacteraceae bacterium]
MHNAILALAGLALAVGGAQAAQAAKAPSPAGVAHGKAIFQQQCGICHAVAPTAGPAAGPMLKGVVGRKAGAGDKNFQYSSSLKGSGLTWTPANLGKFLANPMALIPGTAMPIALPSASDRDDTLAYLATLK